jgi:uncharacterized protein YbjT (DUF2867 family)
VNVLVTGGTGTLGREVVRVFEGAGHRVVTMSRRPAPTRSAAPRWAPAHLVTCEGLAAAVADVNAIVHAASDPRGDPAADVEGTRHLAEAARAAGVEHLVYVSIVGVDRIPLPYYERKLAAERALAAAGVGHSVLRATQFHPFVDGLFGKAAAYMPWVMPLPAGYHVQPVAVEDVAARLLRAIGEGPGGLLPDYGGPERLTVRGPLACGAPRAGCASRSSRFPASAPRRVPSGPATTRCRATHARRIAAGWGGANGWRRETRLGHKLGGCNGSRRGLCPTGGSHEGIVRPSARGGQRCGGQHRGAAAA